MSSISIKLDLKNYSKLVPSKNQLLKWVGNKQELAAEITRHFPVEFNTYHEPF